MLQELFQGDFFSLSVLKWYNNHFKILKNAVLFKNREDVIEFLLIEKIFYVSGSYILYGSVSEVFNEIETQYWLSNIQNKNFIFLSSNSNHFSYEFYSTSGEKYIVPYYNLNVSQ